MLMTRFSQYFQKKMRDDCVQEFKKIFAEGLKLGQDLYGENFVLSRPQIARHQSHRNNPETSSAEEYFYVTLYNEFLSHVTRELEDRFSRNLSLVHGLLHLIPRLLLEKA